MVAFIDNKMAVVSNAVVNDVFANQPLNERNIKHAVGFPSSASDLADGLRKQIEKCAKPLDPLFEQLSSMHEHQRVDATLGDQPCSDYGFSKGGAGGQNARIVSQHRICRGKLLLAQFSAKLHHQWPSTASFVANGMSYFQVRKEFLDVGQAAARQTDVIRMIFGAGNDPYFRRYESRRIAWAL